MEATSGQPVELYDFLYKDEKRIASWYAQLFAGRTINIERSNTTSENTTSTTKGGIPQALSLESGRSSSESKSRKDSIDPHDMATVEVMSFLVDQELLANDVENSPTGKLVLFSGEFLAIDGSTLKLASKFIEGQMKELASRKREPGIPQLIENLKVMSQFFSGMDFPSAFMMATDSGCQVGGTLREEGMQEPIVSYYFKHALRSLPSVFCIGVKEVGNPVSKIKLTEMFSSTDSLTNEMSKLLFTEETIRVTPLAIFRKLA